MAFISFQSIIQERQICQILFIIRSEIRSEKSLDIYSQIFWKIPLTLQDARRCKKYNTPKKNLARSRCVKRGAVLGSNRRASWKVNNTFSNAFRNFSRAYFRIVSSKICTGVTLEIISRISSEIPTATSYFSRYSPMDSYRSFTKSCVRQLWMSFSRSFSRDLFMKLFRDLPYFVGTSLVFLVEKFSGNSIMKTIFQGFQNLLLALLIAPGIFF